MGSIIIAVPNPDNAGKIAEILKRHGFNADASCTMGAEVLRKVGTLDYGVVICTKKLKDMGVSELFEYLPDYFHVLLLSSDVDDYLPRDGIMRLSNPFKAADLVNTLDMMLSTLAFRIKKNRKRPVRSLEDQETIEKAKLLLMDRNDMTEPEAFRYIQKTSMDTGRSMVESAEMILMMNWER